MNPFLNRIAKAGASGHGKASEQRLAKKTGAKLHLSSGAMDAMKSDASLKDFRVEMKSTVKDKIQLEKSWLEKISHEAVCHHQTPALTLSFVNGDGSPQMSSNAEWVAIPLWKFQELVGE